ncbi:universal stress protein [Microbacterium sp.]|uniref:universal stress protein n=1 Tax=Microbacterium sp. TaxID=51671 RepID=UPI000926051A|nr:universal stress protein [Microbacterium sp.]MBN9193410.1 universal stress protein [Microbacterium sp.]OJU71813.1 MAG: universal stress protein UspA [Microbacterium sp. 70-38]
MSGRIVVGYTATKAGADAVALGSRLAVASGASLDLVLVLPNEERSVITPPDPGYERYLRGQAEQWLAGAADMVPASVEHREHVRYAESFAEGLTAVADEIGAALIVVGTAQGGARGRHTIGSTSTELLHSSDVPVVLAPKGSRKTDASAAVPRITVAVGTRPGAEALLQTAASLATSTGAAVRLLSLVTVDLPPTVDTGVIRLAGAAHADDVLARAKAELSADVPTEVVVARGDSIETAVRGIEWLPGELVLVGSSRLAQPRRLFLGSTAAKMLRELPVPMIVVPRALGPSVPGATHPEEGGR